MRFGGARPRLLMDILDAENQALPERIYEGLG
jgi:hypothetical protein